MPEHSSSKNSYTLLLIVFIVLSILAGIGYVFVKSNNNFEKIIEPESLLTTSLTPCSDETPYSLIDEALIDPAAICFLNLGGQELSAVPAELFQLSGLEKLYLHDNQLTSLPDELANLNYLYYLDLGKNKFSEFPTVLFSLPKLEELDINTNQITSLPTDMIKLNKLKSLTV